MWSPALSEMTCPFFTRLIGACLLILLNSAGAAFTPEPSESELEAKAAL